VTATTGDLFGQRLRAARKAKAISGARLGAMSGHSDHYVTGIEAGRRNVYAEDADQLCRTLGVSLAELLDPQNLRADGSEQATDAELRNALMDRIRDLATEATDELTVQRMGPRWGQVLLAELAVTLSAYRRLHAEISAQETRETRAVA
jgi:transcriptional regulator with XRE-family HTH domain